VRVRLRGQALRWPVGGSRRQPPGPVLRIGSAAQTAYLVFQAVALRDLGSQYAIRIRFRDYVRLVVGAFPYMLVLAVAALRAAIREYTGRKNWEPTRHVGAHLEHQLVGPTRDAEPPG